MLTGSYYLLVFIPNYYSTDIKHIQCEAQKPRISSTKPQKNYFKCLTALETNARNFIHLLIVLKRYSLQTQKGAI